VPASRSRAALPGVLLVIVGLPAATLVAGVGTLALIGQDGLDRVADPVRRTAQVQQVDDAADRQAALLAVRGELRRVADGGVRLTLSAAADASLPETLLVRLEHPLDARLDRTLPLTRADGEWQGAGFDADTGWRVALGPVDGRWRVVGRWPRGAEALALLPALATGPDRADGPG
jgi:hypothetical protein